MVGGVAGRLPNSRLQKGMAFGNTEPDARTWITLPSQRNCRRFLWRLPLDQKLREKTSDPKNIRHQKVFLAYREFLKSLYQNLNRI